MGMERTFPVRQERADRKGEVWQRMNWIAKECIRNASAVQLKAGMRECQSKDMEGGTKKRKPESE
jgi:hypothetical protein